jgi:hypothetical protein
MLPGQRAAIADYTQCAAHSAAHIIDLAFGYVVNEGGLCIEGATVQATGGKALARASRRRRRATLGLMSMALNLTI